MMTHKIFVTTFLGFGTNEARRRHIGAFLADATPPKTTNEHDKLTIVRDPCLNPGLLYSSDNITLEGTGDFAACQQRTLPLLNLTVACTLPPCLFNGVHSPGIDYQRNQFIGISEYWHSIHDTLGLSGAYFADEYERIASLFCARHWKDIQSEHVHGHTHTKIELDRLKWQCFKAAWLSNVLHHGMGVPKESKDMGHYRNDTSSVFQSVDKVGMYSVTWTLGAVLLDVVRIPPVKEGGWGWLIGHYGIEDGVEHRAVGQGIGWGFLILVVGLGWTVWTVWRTRQHQLAKQKTHTI
jgi:Golgi nucleoside diphosphatase